MIADGEGVVAPRVEVVELVHAIQHISHELLQEDAWGDTDLPAERTGHCRRERLEVAVVNAAKNAISVVIVLDVDAPHSAAELDEPGVVEPGETELNCTGVVESSIGGEVSCESLGQWREPLDSLWAIEERRGAGDQQIEAREASTVDFVEHLPQR